MGTYVATWQCVKCGAQVSTKQEMAGFLYGYGESQLCSGPCPRGGDHEWHKLIGNWV